MARYRLSVSWHGDSSVEQKTIEVPDHLDETKRFAFIVQAGEKFAEDLTTYSAYEIDEED